MSFHFGKLCTVGELSVHRVGSPAGDAGRIGLFMRASWAWQWALCALSAALALGCTPTLGDTVDLGDNPETPELSLDKNFFHCQIQPLVLTAQSCASGGPGEAGSCHAARSALRLVDVPVPSLCQNNRLVGNAAAESIVNLERVRSSVGADADASPLYRRPLGLDSHPRTIFTPDSQSALLLRMWLNGQAAP
ncbi:MAG: hypothetical protein JWN48_4444 [Myxococcaceae bacterium]|nr:hypothetical protein [Myxococcaceae bacterium]